MLRQKLRNSGRALFRKVSPKSSTASGAGWDGSDGGSIISEAGALPNIRRKITNSWSAVTDTYFSTKEVFESHRVVFTIGTSIASVLTAWAGYSMRQIHQSNLERRLGSLEEAMRSNNDFKHEEIKRIVKSGNVSTEACVATAATTLLLGYALGWRGGSWFALRKFRKEQSRKVGQMKQNFLRRLLMRRATRTHIDAELFTANKLRENAVSRLDMSRAAGKFL